MTTTPTPIPPAFWLHVSQRGWAGPFLADSVDGEGDSVLLYAVPEVAMTRAFLENGAHVHLNTQGRRETPLIRAVRHNHIDCVALLLEWGADVLPLDVYGVDALMYAVSHCPEAIPLLVSHGADPHRPLGTAHKSALERAGEIADSPHGDSVALGHLQTLLAHAEKDRLQKSVPESRVPAVPGKKL